MQSWFSFFFFFYLIFFAFCATYSPKNMVCAKLTVGLADFLLTLSAGHWRTLRRGFPFNCTWFLDVSQVVAKRTNRPGISTTDRGFPRARFRSRGGSFSSRARYYSGYTPPRGRGRAFRWAEARRRWRPLLMVQRIATDQLWRDCSQCGTLGPV